MLIGIDLRERGYMVQNRILQNLAANVWNDLGVPKKGAPAPLPKPSPLPLIPCYFLNRSTSPGPTSLSSSTGTVVSSKSPTHFNMPLCSAARSFVSNIATPPV